MTKKETESGGMNIGQMTVWAPATLVTDLMGEDVFQSTSELSAKTCVGWTMAQNVICEILSDCRARNDENDAKI